MSIEDVRDTGPRRRHREVVRRKSAPREVLGGLERCALRARRRIAHDKWQQPGTVELSSCGPPGANGAGECPAMCQEELRSHE
jgi:hypothetical protein